MQLQDALDGAKLRLHEQIQQLSSRAKVLCQALKAAVDLLLECIRATQQAAGSLSQPDNSELPGDEERPLLCQANAEAIAAMVDLSVSEVSLQWLKDLFPLT